MVMLGNCSILELKRIQESYSKVLEATDYASKLGKLEDEYIKGANEIGKKYSIFDRAYNDDNCLYVDLKPAIDLSISTYGWEPNNKLNEEFVSLLGELKELAKKTGCIEPTYTFEPRVYADDKTNEKVDYLNFIHSKVDEDALKSDLV